MSATISAIPKLFNYQEAAQELTISPKTLRRWVCQGKIPCKKIGGSVRFTEDQLVNFIKDKNS